MADHRTLHGWRFGLELAQPMKKITKFWPWVAAICSGLLYAACFAPFNLTWFCWIALIPLIAAVWFSGTESRRPWLRNLLLGYVAGLTFFWTVFSWLTTVTVLGWFVLQFYMAIYLAIWAWFCGLVRPRRKIKRATASKWDQMLAQARSSRSLGATAVDKFDKQPATRLPARSGVDNA